MKKLLLLLILILLFLVTSCSLKEDVATCGDATCALSEVDFCYEDCPNTDIVGKNVEVVCSGDTCGKYTREMGRFEEVQSKVASCLGSYFAFRPTKVRYELELRDDALCQDPNGCCCNEGGLTDWSRVTLSNLPGFVKASSKQPLSRDLLPDEHETVHYILFQILGDHPLWFSEAIAIQTNERVQCDVAAMVQSNQAYARALRGDAYLLETQADLQGNRGVIMSNGEILDKAFYRDLKAGNVVLTNYEQQDTHLKGALWIIGLKEDYNCGKECVQKIVLELRTHVDDVCQTQGRCVIDQQFPRIITNEIIEEKTTLVVGKGVSELFGLLEI